MADQVDSGAIDIEPSAVRRLYAVVTKRGSILSESDTASVYKMLNPTLLDGTEFRMLTTSHDYPTTIESPDELGEIIGCVDEDDEAMGNTLMMVQVLGVNSKSADGAPLDLSIVFVTCYGSLPEGAIIFMKYPMTISYSEGSSTRPQSGQTGDMVRSATELAASAQSASPVADAAAQPAASASLAGKRWLWPIFGVVLGIAAAILIAILFLRTFGPTL